MIYITGDTHADFRRFSVESFYEQKEMTNQDENFVIICGDYGGVWDQEESKNEKGELPKIYKADNEYDEGRYIVEQVEHLKKKEDYKPDNNE